MEYRLMNDPGDHKAYEEARKRGEHVYLMKLGKGPLVIANMPEEPKDRHRHPDPSTCGYYEEDEVQVQAAILGTPEIAAVAF